jgi:hypothetical protein
MPGGLGPRFALEAGFLIVLAAVAAYARLDAAEIILVMAAGWLLAALFEVLSARRERLYPGATWERRVETHESPGAAVDVPEAEREPVAQPQRPAEATPAAPPPVEDGSAASEAAPPAPSPAPVDDDATGEIELPRRRRWFRRAGPEPETPPGAAETRPSARHVRLIRESAAEEDELEPRTDAEARP